MASPTQAASSAVYPSLLQNLDTHLLKVVLFELIPAPALAAAELDHPETTPGLRQASLAGDLAAYRYKQIILLLRNPPTRLEYLPEASSFLGEVYRLRNEARAERECKHAVETTPRYMPSHWILGLLLFKRGNTGESDTRLRQYLALDPAAADRTYVEYYISLMDSPAPADNNLPKVE